MTNPNAAGGPDDGLPVVIVGGGPVGLALAGDLGWRGVPCLLVEAGDGSIYQPKMDGVNVRTMEFCRRWGIAEAVRQCDYPQDFPQDMVYLTSFRGFELGRESFVSPSGGSEDRRHSSSPERRVRCPQNLFDPILKDFAQSQPTVRLLYKTRFLGLRQDEDGVDIEIEDEAGTKRHIRAAYLVGCDGASSAVRKAVGIGMEGGGTLTYTTNVIFSCPDFVALHDKLPGYRHILIGPEGTWGTIVAINGRDQWRLSIIGTGEPRKLADEEIAAAIERALGAPFAFEVLSVVPWVRRELVATRYREGRVLLAGDSAHVMSPTGGFGMNTGIGDAVDLAWKLEAVLGGWGGEALLDSYGAERRPVAVRAAREASGNLLRTLSPGENPGLLEKSREGALLRYRVGRKLSATMLREWYKLGIDLGYGYEGSPVIGPDEAGDGPQLPVTEWLARPRTMTPALLREWHKLLVHLAEGSDVDPGWQELDPAEVMIYRPQARPGHRAPHVWLAKDRSTLDLFGRGFTLLAPEPGSGADAFAETAGRIGLPLEIVALSDPAVHDLYRARLVLVRPDGHVAWRGDALPAQGVEALLDTVRGVAREAAP